MSKKSKANLNREFTLSSIGVGIVCLVLVGIAVIYG